MAVIVRVAAVADVSEMVALSAAKRAAYAPHAPLFWRPAADADAKQDVWFRHLLTRETTIALVVDGPVGLDGFVVGLVQSAPPVYDPGGLTLTVDDFCVRDASFWPTVGAALLADVRGRARARGAVQVVVVCGVHDAAKRSALDLPGLSRVSDWFTGPL